ncbi:ATP synthase subunit s, mitochondrial isoform X4 [Rhinolophus ferrumequinum]|uniref:ATP synthase subunit s, mitochondrial isoform X4 n=1 Tax=Rhinolophus ferrumequinum TaxID=59479 RepID=UPI00140FE432|nr:ATP synthase subunit s, mitochondrial isoform X4 [Rhinolophus ferrumequinum]
MRRAPSPNASDQWTRAAEGEGQARRCRRRWGCLLAPSGRRYQIMLFGKISRQLCGLKKLPWSYESRYFWGWLNAVFNKVDYERIRDVGPDRAASEWLLRCGAMVRYHGQERWQNNYNNLPTGPLNKYKIQAIDATDSCIMGIGFDHMAC